MNVLRSIRSDRINRVYEEIDRLLTETQGRIRLQNVHALKFLIKEISGFINEDIAEELLNELIQEVNRHDVVNDDALFTYYHTALDRVRGITRNTMQELANQRQNTHKKEVHASVATSVKRLQEKYKDKLPIGDIFDLVFSHLQSVFPANMDVL